MNAIENLQKTAQVAHVEEYNFWTDVVGQKLTNPLRN